MEIPKFDKARVLTVGDAMLDRYWLGDTNRISAEAPIPVLEITDTEDRPGGAANVALNLASLGAGSLLIAATGKDEMAQVLRQKLDASGIQSILIESQEHPTTTKIRLVSKNQQLVRADFETAFAVDSAALIKRIKQFTDYDNIILSDYDKGLLDNPEAIIQYARKQKIPVLVDPKFKPFSAYQGATLIKPNRLELERAIGAWSSEAEMTAKCNALMNKLGNQAMLITRSSAGMTLLLRDAEEIHFPAHARGVYDTTGAGDTVIAVMAAALASGLGMRDAAALANIAAGIVVGQFGVTSVSFPELRLHLLAKNANNTIDTGEIDTEPDKTDALNTGKLSAEQLLIAVKAAKARGERIVFTNGCFDILHVGHVDFLAEAKQEGERLIVALNDDASVTRLKGKGRPINSLDRRATILAGLASVDWVVPFAEDTPEALLEQLQPDLLVKGGDYTIDQVVGADRVRAYGGEIKVLQFIDDSSTTALIEKIRQSQSQDAH